MFSIDDYKAMLTAAQMSLYVGCALMSELLPTAENVEMMKLMYATSEAVTVKLPDADEVYLRGMCIETRKVIRNARKLVMKQDYPAPMREGRAGWLEGAKRLLSEMESVR